MWQSMKKFFKRIADCTGISWIARKISSGWNNIKNWWSGSKVSNADPLKNEAPEEPSEIPVNEPSPEKPEPKLEPVINSIGEDKGKLKLSVNNNILYKNFNHIDPTQLKCVYIQCDKGKFEVTLGKLLKVENNCASFSIKSVKCQSNETTPDKIERFTAFLIGTELSRMKNLLGMNQSNSTVIITDISKDPITVSKTVEGNTPDSGITGPGVQPHAAGAGHSK
jgi:hypothetical protein